MLHHQLVSISTRGWILLSDIVFMKRLYVLLTDKQRRVCAVVKRVQSAVRDPWILLMPFLCILALPRIEQSWAFDRLEFVRVMSPLYPYLREE